MLPLTTVWSKTKDRTWSLLVSTTSKGRHKYMLYLCHIYRLFNIYYAFLVKSTGLVPRGNFQRSRWALGQQRAGNGAEEDSPCWGVSCSTTRWCRAVWDGIRCPSVGVLWHFRLPRASETRPWHLGHRPVPLAAGAAGWQSGNRCSSGVPTVPLYIETTGYAMKGLI